MEAPGKRDLGQEIDGRRAINDPVRCRTHAGPLPHVYRISVLAKRQVGILFGVVIAEVYDGRLTLPFARRLLPNPTCAKTQRATHVRKQVYGSLGPPHPELRRARAPQLLGLGDDRGQGRRIRSANMDRDAQFLDLYFYTGERGEAVGQLLSQEWQHSPHSHSDRMTERDPRPPDLKSSASGIDDARHIKLSFEVARIMS
jgi:hypothetical protein